MRQAPLCPNWAHRHSILFVVNELLFGVVFWWKPGRREDWEILNKRTVSQCKTVERQADQNNLKLEGSFRWNNPLMCWVIGGASEISLDRRKPDSEWIPSHPHIHHTSNGKLFSKVGWCYVVFQQWTSPYQSKYYKIKLLLFYNRFQHFFTR